MSTVEPFHVTPSEALRWAEKIVHRHENAHLIRELCYEQISNLTIREQTYWSEAAIHVIELELARIRVGLGTAPLKLPKDAP